MKLGSAFRARLSSVNCKTSYSPMLNENSHFTPAPADHSVYSTLQTILFAPDGNV